MQLHPNRLQWVGFAELALAQCAVGVNVVTGKYLIAYFPIFLLLMLRFGIGLISMLMMVKLKRSSTWDWYRHFCLLSSKDKFLLFIQAMCGGFLFNILLLFGMRNTNAAAAGIINGITPVLILVLSFIFLREKITWRIVIAMIVAVAGLWILNTGKEGNSVVLGNGLIFLAVIPEAFFTILSKLFGNKLNQFEIVILINLFNLFVFIPFAMVSLNDISLLAIPIESYLILLLYGFSGGLLFFLLWYQGLTKVAANKAALFTAVMPISTTVLAY